MGLAAKTQPILYSSLARRLDQIRQHPWLETLLVVLVSGVVYGIGFSLSISTFLKDNLSVCWPLAGLQVAAFLRIPRRYWLSMLTGMVISQVILEWWEPMDEIVVDVIGDVGEVVFAAFALPALNGLSNWIKQPRLLQRFILWPMVLGPALTAFPVAFVFGRELHVGFWYYWARWFTGDMLGIALWLPLGVVLISRETLALFTWKLLPRTLSLIGTISLAAWGLFHYRPIPIAFILLPMLLLIALKLGFSGSVIAVNILSIVSAKGTLQHLGPFGSIPEPYSVTTLQVFLTFSMLICFPISIILLERDTFECEIKDAYERMEQLAISDSLTGLANRRRFDTVFDDEWRRALRAQEPLGVIMIDVDCFKRYNDLYGHLAGDNCLRRIAETIDCTLRRAGDLAARFGGEEFVVLMPRAELSGVLEVAEMIRSQVELLHLEHTGNPHRIVTISLGCWSIVPTSDIQPEALIEAADQGLYSAKQSGRNRIATLMPELHQPVSQAS